MGRTNERSKMVGERAHRQTIFEGLEDIDNMISGEHIHPNSERSRGRSPEQALHVTSRPGAKRQLAASQRMHNGQCSAGETDDVAEQIHQLTTLPQVVAPGGVPSPQLTSRARKYRRVCESSGPQYSPSPFPEIKRPASSRSSRSHSSKSSSRKSERHFKYHQDLFATVLSPRSRSTVTKVNRPRPSSNDETATTARSISPLGSSAQSSTAPHSTSSNSSSLTSEGSISAAAMSPCAKIGPREKQNAFKALRLLIFGQDKKGTDRDKLRVFHEEIGTLKQSKEFFKFWIQADPELHGSADYTDFQVALHHLENSANVHRLQSLKIASLLMTRQSGLVTMEDVAEAIWPEITSSQVAQIWQHLGNEQEKVMRRTGVAEPPLLAEEDRKALECVFSDLDEDNTGYVSFEALVAARDDCKLPIIDDVDRLKQCMAEWGATDRGCITLEQFLLLMCPAGFRAFESSNVATLESGSAITRSDTGTWYMQDGDEDSMTV